MTAHVTKEAHDELRGRVEKHGERIDELQVGQARTEANVEGLKEQVATSRKEQREDFKEVHARISKSSRVQTGLLITVLLAIVGVLVKLNL